MTHGELFAGISGFGAGFAEAGIKTTWAVEICSHARRVLRHHYPDLLILEDIKNVGKHNLHPVDVISGGFPCQDLSVAGRRAGLKGVRSGLFYEMTRIVDELKPALVVWENVPGLLTSNRGRDFFAVLCEMDRIGYSGSWTTLDARWFGVAQRRRRVFGVFARSDIGAGCTAEILALSRRGNGHIAPGGEAQPNLATTTGISAEVTGTLNFGNDKGGFRTEPGEHLVAAKGGNNTKGPIDVATACNASHTSSGRQDFESETFVVGSLQAHAKRHGHAMTTQQAAEEGQLVPFIINAAESCAKESHARETDTARCLDQAGGFAAGQGRTVILSGEADHGQRDEARDEARRELSVPGVQGQEVPGGGRTGDDPGSDRADVVAFNIVGLAQQGKNHAYEADATGAIQHKGNSASGNEAGTVVAFKESQSGCREGRIHATLDANKGSRRQEGVVSGMMVRRLTPVECSRLQAFPGDWLDLDPPLSDSTKYRLLGNAVCRKVAVWIGHQIVKHLRKEV